MKNIDILDCTLRDGGFVNDWDFGGFIIRDIVSRLDKAKIDIIEVGYIDDSATYSANRAMYSCTADIDRCLSYVNVDIAMLVAIIDYGSCSIERIDDRINSILDGIRLTFKKNEIDAAICFSEQIKRKGYKLFLQPVSITSYTETELLELVQKANSIEPFAFSIVDTYGLMFKEDLKYYFHLINRNLIRTISIGYHPHNNYLNAFTNCTELLRSLDGMPRKIILDVSLRGMGKSAGNAHTELLANYMNEKYQTAYEMNQLLEIIDSHIMPIYRHSPWGYSIEYFISASHDCHPDYVKYLISQGTLSIESINNILHSLPSNTKLSYDKTNIEELYFAYQAQHIDDTTACNYLGSVIARKPILIIAPGKSITMYQEQIENRISAERPYVIAVNFIPDSILVDCVFVSNAKRYAMLLDAYTQLEEKPPIIATSNIVESTVPIAYFVNLRSLLTVGDVNLINSTLMLLNMLKRLKICEPVFIAGFDGFSNDDDSYASPYMHTRNTPQKSVELNSLIAKQISQIDQELCIEFITPSVYHDLEAD